jgi:protein-L-isoaspartate(D-aspartate) O-methyltransferase
MSDFATARQRMVDGQVRPSDVTDLRIIDAMLAVPREAFVPASLQKLAYLDLDLEVSGAGDDKRFLLKPAVIARMLQAAGITSTDRVLVVGCTTGYIAAITAHLGAHVTLVTATPELVTEAGGRLASLGLTNVSVEAGTAAQGCVASAPYNVIVMAGATEVEPQDLCRQLAPDGRLVGIFATTNPQRAVLVARSHDDFGSRALFDASAPVLAGLEKPKAFVF